jgi:hypothetical protein
LHGCFPSISGAPDVVTVDHALWYVVAMFWAYFDESGLHAPQVNGGGLRKLTVAGCIADEEAWNQLSVDWSAALSMWGLPVFHMVDFENRVAPYNKWTPAERKERLNILLEIIGRTKAHCCGFTNIVRSDDNTAKVYERCVYDTFLELSMNWDEKFSIVFAHHPEYGKQEHLYTEMLAHGLRDQAMSCTIGHPINVVPLQAADIVAYEICKDERMGDEREKLTPRRYPLERLFALGCPFRLSSAVE